jgi:dihydroflavonol-4-reductase
MIAITGVSGLTGANLARELLAQGRQVRGLVHRDQRAVAGLDIELAQADIRDSLSLRGALTGVEVVYHLAARISLETKDHAETEATNVQGTRNVVQACLERGVRRLVHFSSIHALVQRQAPLDRPLDEDRPRVSGKSRSPYDRSKAQGEVEALRGMAGGLEVVILNPTAMIGPYDYYPSYMGKALLALAQGHIPALVRGGFDWVDVRDVAQAAMQAERVAESGSSYILSGHWRSVREIADLTAELTGRGAPLFTVPTGLAYIAAPLMGALARLNNTQPIFTRLTLDALNSNRQISHARASRDLGYQPRPLRDTVRDTLDWFAQNGYLRDAKHHRSSSHD